MSSGVGQCAQSISLDQMDALFPFGVLVDPAGNLCWVGRTIQKLFADEVRGKPFHQIFEILAPSMGLSSEGMDALINDIVVLRPHVGSSKYRLRGQCLKWYQGHFFALTLVLTEIDRLDELKLDFSDFALSDPIFDLLLLVQSERRVIQELKRLSEREKMALAQLAMASRLSSLGEMSAGIAHEINNPLAIIQMACEQFLDSPGMSTDRAMTIIRRAQNAALRIARIVSGLRTYARDGSLENVTLADAVKLVEDTLVLCENRFRGKGVELLVGDFPTNTQLECNIVQISQILMNLLNNAFDSVEPRDERWVRLELVESEQTIAFRVSDSGPLLPQEIADRVMQPFFTTKPVGKGTGLGLPISLGIAEAHGGRLFLEQSSGHPCFVLELPRRQSK